MTIWETQELEEMARNAQWEEINDVEEPVIDLDGVVQELDEVIRSLNKASRAIEESLILAKGFPVEQEISTVFDEVAQQLFCVETIRKELKEVKIA